MVKPDTLFKRTTNWLLDFVAANFEREQVLPSEKVLAVTGDVSRTTIRTALEFIEHQGILDRRDRARVVRRLPDTADYFDRAQLINRSDQIRDVFMAWIFRGRLNPGESFSETALARASGASTASVREYLIGFSRFGLIEKKARGGWRLCTFDADFARDLADMREMLELKAIGSLRSLEETAHFWIECDQVEEKHRRAKQSLAASHEEFGILDREFHALIVATLDNRFVNSFYEIISFIYHYHYQWTERDQLHHSFVALEEHLSILGALNDRDFDAARDRMQRHLDTARQNLLDSIQPPLKDLDRPDRQA